MTIPSKRAPEPPKKGYAEGEVVEDYVDEKGRTIRVIHEHRVVEERGGSGCCGCWPWIVLAFLFGTCG
ncbi:hypothetical protein H8D30_00245 [bacterium]|nr:hypothetical protein [bacterium]